MGVLTVGTRRSRLALIQTRYVCTALQQAWPALTVRLVEITTEGDRLSGNLSSGGKGLFTSALEEALTEGRIDIAVHSLKDLPIDPGHGLTLGAILGRETARDVLVTREGYNLDTLPAGSTIGTSSRRRRAQLNAHRPDLSIVPIRGNVDTRVQKMLDRLVDALVLAQAGLQRLGINHAPQSLIPLKVMLPAPGQGALAVQCRTGAEEAATRLEAVDDRAARQETTAERTFLSALGGGCASPIGAFARTNTNNQITMQGMVASPDGDRVIRVEGAGTDPETLGTRLAQQALEHGAAEVLRVA